MDVSQLLSKWADARATIAALEKKVDQYKQVMTRHMLKNNIAKYEDDDFIVRQTTQNRSVITKKSVPAEVWEAYATPHKTQFLLLTEKKKEKKKQKQPPLQQLV